jgi:hypothetical protein
MEAVSAPDWIDGSRIRNVLPFFSGVSTHETNSVHAGDRLPVHDGLGTRGRLGKDTPQRSDRQDAREDRSRAGEVGSSSATFRSSGADDPK